MRLTSLWLDGDYRFTRRGQPADRGSRSAGAGFVAGNSDAGAGAVHLIRGGETMVRSIGVACNIKGNISTTGERYFCSEAEAMRAGWRRSKV